MPTVEIKTLFDRNRYPSDWTAVTLLLYSPFGLILAIVRLFIILQALLAAALLPHLSVVRRFVLQSLGIVLGVVVKEQEKSCRNESVRLLVSNHLTYCDHIAIHLVSSCVVPCTWEKPAPICQVFGIRDLGLTNNSDAVIAGVRDHLVKRTTPVLMFPEGATTNGKVGLLKFSTWPFLVTSEVQPVVLHLWRPPLIQVTPSALGANWWADVFWFLFSPCTVFTLKYLPVMRREENEDPVKFTSRVEQTMANALGIVATKHTASDKAEYEKRFLLEQSRPAAVSGSSYLINQELQRMAHQVKEVLPFVPNDIILRDLGRTHNVDVTISNILEGNVSPTISQQTPSAASTNISITGISHAVPSVSQGPCLDTSAPSFPRSAQERMLSFNERKARLIENARQKYIEKHGLNLPGFNNC